MDSDLIEKSRTGDPQAIEALVNEHQLAIYRLCFSILEDQDDAQDATQETFIAVVKSLKSYRGDSALRTWIFAIALNTCRAFLRKRQRQAALFADLNEASLNRASRKPSPERQAIQTEMSQTVLNSIAQLNEKHRLPIILRYYHELSTKEIAEILNIRLGTVHSRLDTARKRIGANLKRSGQKIAAKKAAGK